MRLSRNRILDTRALHRLVEDSDEVGQLKTLLNESNDVLRSYHLGGAPSQDIVTAHAWLVDQDVKAIWRKKVGRSHSLPLVAMAGLNFIRGRTSIYWYSFKRHPLKHNNEILNRWFEHSGMSDSQSVTAFAHFATVPLRHGMM